MYSLVSASVLAIDLARHPGGAAVADVVDRVLALTPDEVARLAPPAPADVRERVLHAVSSTPRMTSVMESVASARELPTVAESRSLLQTLEETLVGRLEDLLALLAREAPLYGAERAQTALDAVTVAWAGRHADLTDLAVLRRPWRDSGTDPVPPALPEAPYSPRLRALLDEVSSRRPEQWRRTADAHGAHRGRRRWSVPMHEACRAAFDADRLPEVARAQLAGARLLRLSGASTGPEAHAIAMAVTAAVQAVCTRDLLKPGVAEALLSAWEAGS